VHRFESDGLAAAAACAAASFTAVIDTHRPKMFVLSLHDQPAFGAADGCYLRVSYGALDERTAAEGVKRLANGLRTLCL